MSHPHASLYATLSRSHGFEPLRIDGVLPPDLHGTLFRTGPAVYERFGTTISHAFEADGAVSAVRLAEGTAQGAVQVVQSAGWREEEAAGRLLYSSGAALFDRLRAMWRGKSKATGNTKMWTWQGDLYALMEGAGPVRIDPDSLRTLGETDLDGVVPLAFSAHPHHVPELGCSFNFGARYGKTMSIDLFALPDAGTARRITTVEAPFNTMVHDFFVTSTHLVLLICPVKLRTWRAVFQIGTFDTWFGWHPELGTEAIVVPLDEPSAVKRFAIDPFWFWHVGNAWTEGTTLHADVAMYPNVDSLGDFGPAPAQSDPPQLHRCTLDLTTGAFHHTPRMAFDFEFPVVHPGVASRRHTTLFGLTEWDRSPHRGIAAVNDDGDMTAWKPPVTEQASEPILVARSDVEDDVWALTLVHDDTADQSYVGVLDGQRLEDGPVAKVWFDQTIPMTFHGVWQT